MSHVFRLFVAGMLAGSAVAQDASVYSGPQVSEALPPAPARYVFGEHAGETFDLVSVAERGPLLMVFVHEFTRPSIGLTRVVTEYAARRAGDDMTCGVVFLSDDATETEAMLKRARHALPGGRRGGIPIGIAVDGQEGPGAYGLNRNIALTVLVGDQGRVTANFALVQPSLQADAPLIGTAISKTLGGEAVKLDDMVDRASRPAMRRAISEDDFRSLLAPVINRSANEEQVVQAAAAVERRADRDAAFRARLGTVARRIIEAGRLENYGTPPAQKYLRTWAKLYAPTGPTVDRPSDASAKENSREGGLEAGETPGGEQADRE